MGPSLVGGPAVRGGVMGEFDVVWWASGEPAPGEMTWDERRDEVAEVFARAMSRLRGRWLGDGNGDVDGEPGVAGDVAIRLDEHADWSGGKLEASGGARPDGGVG